MLKLFYSFIWWLRLKPPILMEESIYKRLKSCVQYKLFSQENLGRALLFLIYKELDKEQLYINDSGHYKPRYAFGNRSSELCWSTDLLNTCLTEAVDLHNSDLHFKRRIDAREMFYLTFGEELQALPSEEPQIGNIVLFPNLSKNNPKIGIVSRILRDNKGVIRKWWYIAGNEGLFYSKVKESRGDNKNIEGFMDLSGTQW